MLKDHSGSFADSAMSVIGPTSGPLRTRGHAADSLIGSRIEELSFSGLLTRVEIGHIRIGSAGNGRIKSCGSGSSLSQRS